MSVLWPDGRDRRASRTMGGDDDRPCQRHHRLRPRRLVGRQRVDLARLPDAARRSRQPVALAPGDTRLRRRRARHRRIARPVAYLLRTRPRPHPARQRLSPAGRQDPGLRLPRRSPTHAPDPRPRGRPGCHLGGPRPRAQRVVDRGNRPRSRLRPRPGRPRQRRRPHAVRRRRLRPCGVGRRCHAAAAQPVRRDARRDPQPLVVATGAVDAGGRGGQLGRPHRLRLPRLRRRRGSADRLSRGTPGESSAIDAASDAPNNSAPSSRP